MNLTLLCTCASVCILSGVERSRWIIKIVLGLHSVNTDEAPGMAPRSLGKGQGYVARNFIFLQLGEARLSPWVSGSDKGGVTGSSYTGLTMAVSSSVPSSKVGSLSLGSLKGIWSVPSTCLMLLQGTGGRRASGA